MTENNIDIKKMIVHILDNNVKVPILSDMEHPMDDDAYDFVEAHISKILKDEGLKAASYLNEECKMFKISRSIAEDPDEFCKYTKYAVEMLYDVMQKNPDIPSADIVCLLFELDTVLYFGILKFNYKPSYIHYVGNAQNGRVNSIIKQKTALPGENQKIDECALINLQDLSIKLLEKKYEINGEKIFYLSMLFLECSSDLSQRDKVKIFKKASEGFNKKYLSESISSNADMKNAIVQSIEERDEIDIAVVADNMFRRNPTMKDAYIEHIEKAGLKDKSIAISEKTAEKIFKKYKIKTDTGIEINLPVTYFNDKDKVEFINNPDGTISIVLKNIGNIVDGN